MVSHLMLAKIMEVIVPTVVACIKKHYRHIESNGVIKHARYRKFNNRGMESKVYFLDRDAVTCVLALSRNSNKVLELAREDMEARKDEAECIIESVYKIQEDLKIIEQNDLNDYDELEYVESHLEELKFDEDSEEFDFDQDLKFE